MIELENQNSKQCSQKVRLGQEIILKINDIGFGGKGVGRYAGMACFVSGVINEEHVRVRISKIKSRFLEASLIEVIEPSPHRIVAPCPVFGQCGGCAYQHIIYQHQLRLKEGQFRESLRRIGGFIDPPIASIIPSPMFYGYRNRIVIHVRDGKIGFFAEKSRHVVPIKQCFIGSPEVDRGFQELLQTSPRDGDYLIGEKKYYGGFRQVNSDVAEILATTVCHAIHPPDVHERITELLVDAYCGNGFFAHRFHELFTKVIGIERSMASISIANNQASENETYWAADVEMILSEVLSSHPSQGTVLLLDPPRDGLSASVISTILTNKPARIVYVSCNPSTLARDAKRLSQHYCLVSATPIDMFPQTAEIESVSAFTLHEWSCS